MVGDSEPKFHNKTLRCRTNGNVGDSATSVANKLFRRLNAMVRDSEATIANKLFRCRSNGVVGDSAPTFASKLLCCSSNDVSRIKSNLES